jgi:hypothetical protein
MGSVLVLMVASVAAVVAVVVIRRRSLRPLLGLRLRSVWLIWLAALLQFVRTRDLHWVGGMLTWRNGVVPVVTMWLLGVAFVVVNLRAVPPRARIGAWVLAAGFSLNTLVMVVNGAMPFATASARWAGFSAEAIGAPAYGHAPIVADTELAAFADVIPVPGLGAVVSIGDLLMVVGIAWLLSRSALDFAEGRECEQVTQGLVRGHVVRDHAGGHLRACRTGQSGRVTHGSSVPVRERGSNESLP